jgi:hypothetical protein
MSTAQKQTWLTTMSTGQKQAWFSLVIVLLSAIVIVAATPVIGFRRAQGGLGFLGLWGFGPFLFLFRKRPGIVMSDERDGLIQIRSWVIAYSIFWVVFVGTCVAAPISYGSTGAVPVFLVQISPFYGLMLVLGISSVATLLQYGWGGSDDAQ